MGRGSLVWSDPNQIVYLGRRAMHDGPYQELRGGVKCR